MACYNASWNLLREREYKLYIFSLCAASFVGAAIAKAAPAPSPAAHVATAAVVCV